MRRSASCERRMASQGDKVSKLGDVDVCKEMLVRLTDRRIAPSRARSLCQFNPQMATDGTK